MISVSRTIFFFLGHLQFLNRYANVAVLTPCFVSPQSPFIPAAADRRERQEGTMLLTMGFGISLEKSAQPLTSWEQSVTTWASFCEFNQTPTPQQVHSTKGLQKYSRRIKLVLEEKLYY